jgi:hypothetical protein
MNEYDPKKLTRFRPRVFGARLLRGLMKFRNSFLLLLALIFFLCVTSDFPFDFSTMIFTSNNYYFNGIAPFYYWELGAYYYLIIIAATFISTTTVLFFNIGYFFLSSAAIKLPIFLSALLTGLVIGKIYFKELKISDARKYALLVFLGNLGIIFYVYLFGSQVIVAACFLTISLYFGLSEQWNKSSLFLALATSMYIFPVFLIPFLMRHIYRLSGAFKVFIFLMIFIIVIALGELIPLLFYKVSGISVISSGSILANQGPLGFSTSLSQPDPFSIFAVASLIDANFAIPSYIYKLFFVSILGIVMLKLAVNYQSDEDNSLILTRVFFLSSALFVVFTSAGAPQYLIFLIPFTLIIAAQTRREEFIPFLTIIFIFDVITQISNNSGIPFGLLWNANSNLEPYRLFLPPALIPLFGTFSALSVLILAMKITRLKRKSSETGTGIKKDEFITFLEKHARAGKKSIVLTFIIVLLLIAPGIAKPSHEPIGVSSLYQYNIEPSYAITLPNGSSVLTFYSPPIYNLSNSLFKQKTQGILQFNTSLISEEPLSFGVISPVHVLPFNCFSEFFWSDGIVIKKLNILLFSHHGTPDFEVCLTHSNTSGHPQPILNVSSLNATVSVNPSSASYTFSFDLNKYVPYGSYSIVLLNSSSFTVCVGYTNIPSSNYEINQTTLNGKIQKNLTLSMDFSAIHSFSAFFNGHELGHYGESFTSLAHVVGTYISRKNAVLLSKNLTNINLNTTCFVTFRLIMPSEGNNLEVEQSIARYYLGGIMLATAALATVYILRRYIL